MALLYTTFMTFLCYEEQQKSAVGRKSACPDVFFSNAFQNYIVIENLTHFFIRNK